MIANGKAAMKDSEMKLLAVCNKCRWQFVVENSKFVERIGVTWQAPPHVKIVKLPTKHCPYCPKPVKVKKVPKLKIFVPPS